MQLSMTIRAHHNALRNLGEDARPAPCASRGDTDLERLRRRITMMKGQTVRIRLAAAQTRVSFFVFQDPRANVGATPALPPLLPPGVPRVPASPTRVLPLALLCGKRPPAHGRANEEGRGFCTRRGRAGFDLRRRSAAWSFRWQFAQRTMHFATSRRIRARLESVRSASEIVISFVAPSR